MTTYVALLRGINVGRNQRIAMADLRTLLADLGHTDVRTLLMSGNAVLTSSRRKTDQIAAEIEEAIKGTMGLTVRCLVRSRDELAAVVDGNPLEGADGSRMMVAFVSATPSAAVQRGYEAEDFAPEQFAFGDRAIYYWCPNGLQNSPMIKAFSEKRLGVTATVRNWNTVTKLLALADA